MPGVSTSSSWFTDLKRVTSPALQTTEEQQEREEEEDGGGVKANVSSTINCSFGSSLVKISSSNGGNGGNSPSVRKASMGFVPRYRSATARNRMTASPAF